MAFTIYSMVDGPKIVPDKNKNWVFSIFYFFPLTLFYQKNFISSDMILTKIR